MIANCCENPSGALRGESADRRPGSAPAWTIGRRLGSATAAAARIYQTWLGRTRERRELAQMSERELHDISLTRCDAAVEIEKPFWRA